MDWDTATPEEEEAYWNLPLFIQRNYDLFAILAGVQNHLRIQPISPPHGIPGDASEAVKAAWAMARKYPEVHTPSWLSLQDLLGFDWDQLLIHRVSRDDEAFRPHSEHFLTYRDAVSDNNFINRDWTNCKRSLKIPPI